MTLKKVNKATMWRCKLLKKCSELELSENTLIMIANLIKTCDNKEETSQYILKKISGQTEDKIIKHIIEQIVCGNENNVLANKQ